MKKNNCKNKRNARNISNPCSSAAANNCSGTSETQCPEEYTDNVQQCPEENQIKICGRVTYRGQGVHLATVVITRNRQIVAECLTDCEGNYEFKGQRANYSLRAHKGNRRSNSRSIVCANGDKFEVNFRFM